MDEARLMEEVSRKLEDDGDRQRKVVGTIDVESDRVDVFSEEDRAVLERCASVVAGIFV
jgi:putative methionine-R-sulfoxide reductase with GAF domain